MAKNENKGKASGTSDQAPAANGGDSGKDPSAPGTAPAPIVDGIGNGASQLGDSGDAPTQDEIEAKAKADAESAENARIEEETAKAHAEQEKIQREQHDKNAAAEAKRARLAEETAAEKAKLREEQKANSIPDAAPAALAAVDPFTAPLGDLSDAELSEQWDALASVEEDLVAENAKREAKIKEQEEAKEEIRKQRFALERDWTDYQNRVNHVLLPRRDAIRKEAQRREEAAAQAAADAAAAKTVAVGS